MPRTVTHEAITAAGPDEIQIVEVLPAKEFERLHLPNATSLPLTNLNRDTAEWLDRSKPVVLYCWDAY